MNSKNKTMQQNKKTKVIPNANKKVLKILKLLTKFLEDERTSKNNLISDISYKFKHQQSALNDGEFIINIILKTIDNDDRVCSLLQEKLNTINKPKNDGDDEKNDIPFPITPNQPIKQVDSKNDREKIAIGADESGKGESIGGLAVCVVYLNQASLNRLKANHALYQAIFNKETKNLKRNMIKKYAPQIMDVLTETNYHVIYWEAQKYNEKLAIYDNLNVMLTIMHDKCYDALLKKHDNQPIERILDQFAEKYLYREYQKNNSFTDERNHQLLKLTTFEKHADAKYLSVGLASIIARYHYLCELEGWRKKYGITIEPKGSSNLGYKKGSVNHQQFRSILGKYEFKTVDDVYHHFFKKFKKNCQKIIDQLSLPS